MSRFFSGVPLIWQEMYNPPPSDTVFGPSLAQLRFRPENVKISKYKSLFFAMFRLRKYTQKASFHVFEHQKIHIILSLDGFGYIKLYFVCVCLFLFFPIPPSTFSPYDVPSPFICFPFFHVNCSQMLRQLSTSKNLERNMCVSSKCNLWIFCINVNKIHVLNRFAFFFRNHWKEFFLASAVW